MSTYHRGLWQISIMTSICLFLLGCSSPNPSPEETDQSPFTGVPCAAPCWQGLMVGKSHESDVISTLPKLSFIDQNSINIHRMLMPGLNPNIESQGAEITATCINPQKPCLTLTIADDLLTGINLILNYEMRLGKAIEYLGDPEYIGYRMMGAEHVACEIDSVWVSRQLVLASESFTGSEIHDWCNAVRDSGKTVSSLLILEAKYLSPGAIALLLSTGAGEFFEFTGTNPE